MRPITKAVIIAAGLAVGAGLVMAFAADGDGFQSRNYVVPPKEWKGSNGVRQPTGFEVPGCPWYKMDRGRMIVICGQDPELGLDRNKNGGVGTGL